jgi:hypothetical protein
LGELNTKTQALQALSFLILPELSNKFELVKIKKPTTNVMGFVVARSRIELETSGL